MKLYLKNIGKIAEADVEIRGITVIAGENNTGKSTVGKTLFSVFNCFHESQKQIRQEKKDSITRIISPLHWSSVFYDGDAVMGEHVSEKRKDIDRIVEDILGKADRYERGSERLENEVKAAFESWLQSTGIQYDALACRRMVEKIWEILKLSDLDIFQSIVKAKINSEFDGQLLNYYSEESGEISLKIYDRDLVIKVFEDSVVADDKGFHLYAEAIYIDDPLVLDEIAPEPGRERANYPEHRKQLESKLFMSKGKAGVVDELVVENKFKRMNEKLMSVCEGDIFKQKNGNVRYRFYDSGKTLSIKNLSTGLKTFVILQTLLKNGAIEDNGTIILDEPEIHLHPEWQLLFAELIVLLHKEFGMHILLNTHSPYFLRAIQVYSAKYGVSDVCRYYLSEAEGDGKAYIHDVTDNIDKIYEKLSGPLQQLEDERWHIDSI